MVNIPSFQAREKERQEKLAVYKETGEWPGLRRKKETVAWSKNKEVTDTFYVYESLSGSK